MPLRNYFGMAVDEVQYNGIEHGHGKLNPALLTGAVALEIEILSPVHVGSGSYGLAGDQVVKEPAQRNGKPVIPGSSLKGVCRQIHEVLTRSSSPFDREQLGNAKPRRPSPSAGLFGRLGFAGRISFDDAVPTAPIELQNIRVSVPYLPQNDVGRRFYGPLPRDADQPGRIRALALPSGAKLETCLRFRNVQDYELSGVLLSLGVGHFTPKIGGGKYDRFGWVRFRMLRYRLRDGLARAKPGWIEDPAEVAALYDSTQAEQLLPPAGRSALRDLTRRLQAPPNERGKGS